MFYFIDLNLGKRSPESSDARFVVLGRSLGVVYPFAGQVPLKVRRPTGRVDGEFFSGRKEKQKI
jgi:hypothetical protein